ncbi:hypothetical protein PENANT_c025G08389 [Penicillium antarcticum]|uniref:Uncharacterized protein n=1 Tax=Penicillium antarcticum TaxID=416450 RepID=A0A1V6PYF0_9EURO|nr:hypothetical protein PENANT_c025G08389 [Penicillium antarcticum]
MLTEDYTITIINQVSRV